MPALLLIFIVVPLVEIYVLIEIGTIIGALPTVLACVGTAILGGGLLRYQGFQTLRRAQRNMDRGQIPAMEMFEGVALAMGGALLLTPGFVTDMAGFLCLIPWTRRALIAAALRRMQVRYTSSGPGGPDDPGGTGGTRGTIEGEFRRRD
ncbi:FxsA family protein [Halofilum ochraceum]|uniref:FxsA family protein n=1 Tax=Halofilum ochraceum TaxID=1611323 RepID=UPI001C2FEBE0|nr:FxsA family protein [Halofilum ochraceum]